jgi:hypothetical protein
VYQGRHQVLPLLTIGAPPDNTYSLAATYDRILSCLTETEQRHWRTRTPHTVVIVGYWATIRDTKVAKTSGEQENIRKYMTT